MAATSKLENEDFESLSALFKEGLDLYNETGRSNEPSNSPEFQLNVKSAMRILEKATQLVSLAGIFSANEQAEEIPTNNLQYLLLPALLGSLSLKLTTGERKEIVEVAEIYFKDFLKRCNDYQLSNYEFKEKREGTDSKTEFEQLAVSVNTRANKIQRFREQKELKTKLEDLKKNMDNQNVDEEVKRNYYLTMIKLFIYEAIDELNSIDMEKPILEHMLKMKSENRKEPKGPPPKPLRPIIITRDEVQKAVFGAGYPSLPTMTVREFYDKKVAEGEFPDPNKKKDTSKMLSLQEASLAGVDLRGEEEEEQAAKEKAEEQDDDEYVERMRRMDEYKDDHRRGWGNRMNRS